MIPNVLADRYASPAMRKIWSAEGRIVLERDFWIAVMKSQRELGLPIPEEVIADYEKVREEVHLDSIQERERISRHDVKARLEEFNDLAGHQEIHKGMTSRDLTENVEQLQIFSALRIIHDKTVASLAALAHPSWRLERPSTEAVTHMLNRLLGSRLFRRDAWTGTWPLVDDMRGQFVAVFEPPACGFDAAIAINCLKNINVMIE